MSQAWQVRLAEQAELDFLDIATWTTQHFGQVQAELYVETILLAMEALHDGPDPLGAKARNDLGPGIRTLHVSRLGRKGRHFVVFMAGQGQCIDVLRLLHDSMDLARHVPIENNPPGE